MLGTHCVKLLQPVSKHTRDQQVSAYNCSFLTIILCLGCKEILFSLLHAKKIADAVFLYVFNRPGVAGAVLQSPLLLIN